MVAVTVTPGVEKEVEDKTERIIRLRKAIAEKFGQQSVGLGSDSSFELDYQPLEVPALDAILDGGLPKRRIIEISGLESCGKTTLLLHAIGKFQKAGALAAFIDAEHAFDSGYAKLMGVNVEELMLIRPDGGAAGIAIVDCLIKTNEIAVIGMDSITAFDPPKEGKGQHAMMMSNGFRKLTNSMKHSCSTLLATNQLRRTGSGGSGRAEPTGGAALRFYASLRLELTEKQKLTHAGTGKTPYGIQVEAKSIKNKTAAPQQNAHFDILYGQGIQSIKEV